MEQARHEQTGRFIPNTPETRSGGGGSPVEGQQTNSGRTVEGQAAPSGTPRQPNLTDIGVTRRTGGSRKVPSGSPRFAPSKPLRTYGPGS